MPYPLPLTRTEAYLAYKAGVIQQSDLKPSLAIPRNGIDAWLAYWTGLAADYPKREDGTPHILQEEEAYISYLCGVINEYPEKCLRRVGAYLRYLISARWGRPDHPLNREELYLSLIKTQFIPSGDPSSDITINGTAKAAFVDVKMYGDIFQQTYMGKNLAKPLSGGSKNGITVSYDATEDAFMVNGTCSSNNTTINILDGVTFESGTDYTLTVIPLSGSVDAYHANTSIQLFTSDYGPNNVVIRPFTGESIQSSTVNFGSNVTLVNNAIRAENVDKFTNFKFRIQIEKNSTYSSYEPFVGGTASPNPSYPQQIHTVTGEQTVEIVGKNLFDKSTVTNGYYIDGSGTLRAGANFGYSDYIPVVAGQTYTYSGSTNNAGYAGKGAWYDSNRQWLSSQSFGSSGQITAPSGAAFYRTTIRIAASGDQEPYLDTYQLELGSTASTYAPYSKQTLSINLGSIELCKLGTYQDYIWKDGEDWKVHKKITKYVCDSTLNWAWDASVPRLSANSATLGLHAIGPINADTAVIGKSNKFVANSFNYVYTQKNNGFAYSPSGFISCVDKEWGSESEAKADILGSIFYFVLQDSYTTDITITETNLIAQLEALVNGGAEDGTTYIKVKATDPNLPGLLYVEAPKYE